MLFLSHVDYLISLHLFIGIVTGAAVIEEPKMHDLYDFQITDASESLP